MSPVLANFSKAPHNLVSVEISRELKMFKMHISEPTSQESNEIGLSEYQEPASVVSALSEVCVKGGHALRNTAATFQGWNKEELSFFIMGAWVG